MFRIILSLFLLLAVPAYSQNRIRITVPTVSQLGTRPPFTNEVIEVLGYSTLGDWGKPKLFRWDATNTLATNSIRIKALPAVGRYVHDWDGDVTVFGAIPYPIKYTAVPWGYISTNSAVGTNDFSLWFRTTFPSTYDQVYGMFEIQRVPGTNTSTTSTDINSSFGLRASPDVWGFVFRSTNGASGAGSVVDDAAVLDSTPALLSAYAGQVVNVVVTRSYTNATVYFNGTNVTSLFTFSNPLGWSKALALGESIMTQIGNNANQWFWPKPITRFARWTIALNSSQAADPEGTGSKVVDFTPEYSSEPPDLSDELNAASDALSSNGGGILYLPTGGYRIGSSVKLNANNSIKGDGAPPYPSAFRRGFRPGTTTLVSWFGTDEPAILGEREQNPTDVLASSRSFGSMGGVNSSRYLRSSIEGITFFGALSKASHAIFLDRVGSVRINNNGFFYYPGYALLSYVGNSIPFYGNEGTMGRGVHFRAGADLTVYGNFLDSPKGPALWLNANLNKVFGNTFEISSSQQGNIPPYEMAVSVDASTDTFTVTNTSFGHRLTLGVPVRFTAENYILLTITNVPINGETLVVNSSGRTWTNTASTTTLVQIGATTGESASNLVTQLTTIAAFDGIDVSQPKTNVVKLSSRHDSFILVSYTTNWVSVTSPLPPPLSRSVDYFVYPVTANTFKVSTIYGDESLQSGVRFGSGFTDITGTVTNTFYVNAGPSVGVLLTGDHNMLNGNLSQQNYGGALRLESASWNSVTGNSFPMNGLSNPDTNIAGVTLINGNQNSIIGNMNDDRDLAGFSQIGTKGDWNSLGNYVSGNLRNVAVPYDFVYPNKNFLSDDQGTHYTWDGSRGSLYVPRRSGFSVWDPRDLAGSGSVQIDDTGNRFYFGVGTNSSNSSFKYAVGFPAEGPIYWSGSASTLNGANSVAGQTMISLNSLYAASLQYQQVNSTTAAEGVRNTYYRNNASDLTTYGALQNGYDIVEWMFGGWYGSAANQATIGASLRVTARGTWSAGDTPAQFEMRVVPDATSSRQTVLTLFAPATPGTNQTALALHFWNGTAWTSREVWSTNIGGVNYLIHQ